MKVVILAGGLGTRLSEETSVKPKPMVEIGEMPILWHIMKIYSSQGFSDFVILLGYKGIEIKKFFSNYYLYEGDITFPMEPVGRAFEADGWTVTLLETGRDTQTGGRIKQAFRALVDEPFFLTYGDGLADVDLGRSLKCHTDGGHMVTMTAVKPKGRYGSVQCSDDGSVVTHFEEKPNGDGMLVNGGFFVCEPGLANYLGGNSTVFEHEPLARLVDEGLLGVYRHNGFWSCMDTLRDKHELNKLWETNQAPWKIW